MKRYYCNCGGEVYFENGYCRICNGELGYLPKFQTMRRLTELEHYRPCQNRSLLDCNWLIEDSDENAQCAACRLTRTIPNLTNQQNLRRWAKLEATKRRAFYMLLKLRLPIPDRQPGLMESSLIFDFLEDKRSNELSEVAMVYTGHHNGIITINAAEADDSFRCKAQQDMQEAYRTLLGHFRHELGHFYWMRLQNNSVMLETFRKLFGDERHDYQLALNNFYRNGVRSEWRNCFISAYAACHPLEDWAECWAHYQHILETLETAQAFGLIAQNDLSGDFAACLSAWMDFSVILNALNRSLGVPDPYPFVINASVVKKLHFVDDWIRTQAA